MEGLPLRCAVEDGKLIICVGFDVLAFAAREHPDFWNGQDDATPNIKVNDPVKFANEVMLKLNEESEDGSTLVTRMVDTAIKAAYEDGCEGIDFD